MKHITAITLFLLINMLNGQAQTKESIVKEYMELYNSDKRLEIHHWPVSGNFGKLNNATIFFVSGWDEKGNDYQAETVIYHKSLEHKCEFPFATFGSTNFDPSYDSGVISVFFENIDLDPENELIVIYEFAGRTHYRPNGGYAGIKPSYETRVFDCNLKDGYYIINEYEIIGDLLTVNLPILTGTFEEEEIIGREDSCDKLRDAVGVTYNAHQVKKRIKSLKEKGFLGGL